MKDLLTQIVGMPYINAAWLNSLSFMENSGARKISRFEDGGKVTLSILKHAAEEARHAYYLKRQIQKLDVVGFEHYHPDSMLAYSHSTSYLNRLDILVARFIRNSLGLDGRPLKEAAYLMVTYAIELRADDLYPSYQNVLSDAGSKVNVKSIILEEEGHLEEMTNQLKLFSSSWEEYAGVVCQIEQVLFAGWIQAIEKQLAQKELGDRLITV